VEFIVTETEKEALILENNLIKQHRPRYNVFFRDDKTYFSIRIELQNQSFPRLQLVRQVKKDGARYFGPYPSSSAAKETLHFLQSIFSLRTCRDRVFTNHHRRPCLEYQIKRCLAPCAGLVDGDTYGRLVRDSIVFLEGRGKGLLADLAARMKTAAAELNFEEAGLLRDRIAAIETTLEKQRIVSAQFKDQDVFGLYRKGDQTQILVFQIRNGKLLGKNAFPLIGLRTESAEILSALIIQYYDGNSDIPAEIIIPCPLEDGAVIAEWLTDKRGKKTSLRTPRQGPARDLVMMAADNAQSMFEAGQQGRENTEAALLQLTRTLGLRNMPRHMEGVDISNVSGKYAVGSLVTFKDGRPWKEGYRRYRIRTIADMDDYGMMREILHRRYAKKENIPDLLMVDGGKGQLNVATTLCHDLGIDSIDIISLAKENFTASPVSLTKLEDRVYLPRRKDPVYIARHPQACFLLQQLRDEAHRFALAYHHKLKERHDFHSLLDEIPGIGKARKKELLSHFGDIKKVTTAAAEDLQKVKGISRGLANIVYAFLKTKTRYK
jgi:excinuclease ABC subunit C